MRTALRRVLVWSGSLAGLLVSVILVSLLLPGCSVGYVTRQSFTHMRVLAARKPVDKAIAAGKVPEEWVPKIEIIQDAREFGVEHLHLPAEDLYRTISLVRPDPTWVVTACPRDTLQPVTWWFPIAGRVAYRGYYDREDADRFADRLRRKDLDVLVRPAGAFSTLGWFSDPIRPSMLSGDEPYLINLVLHEAAHRVLYVKGQTDFNESFAAFVGDTGTLLYLEEVYGSRCDLCRQTLAGYRDSATFSSFLESVVDELQALYSRPIERQEKIQRREEVFRRAAERYREQEWEGDSYSWFPEEKLDNAVVLSLRRYQGERQGFHTLLERCDGDLPRTVAVLAGEIKKKDPFGRLEALLAQGGCPDS